jgi:hypothetical protein
MPAGDRLVDDEMWRTRRGSHKALTNAGSIGNLGCMALSPPRLDPERRRRRAELLALLAEAKSVRESTQPRRLRGSRIRELIAMRRRLVN